MKFGDFLVLEGIVTRESLNLALREQHHRRPSFGATAVTLGYLGPNELSRWLEHQAKYPGRLGDILIRERRLTRREVDAIIAEQQAHSEPLGTLLSRLGLISSREIEAAYRRYQTTQSTGITRSLSSRYPRHSPPPHLPQMFGIHIQLR